MPELNEQIETVAGDIAAGAQIAETVAGVIPGAAGAAAVAGAIETVAGIVKENADAESTLVEKIIEEGKELLEKAEEVIGLKPHETK